jgi:hypothetical protein
MHRLALVSEAQTMTTRFHHLSSRIIVAGLLGLALANPALAQQSQWREPSVYRVVPVPWLGPVLPDGQPDVSGHWSNTISNHNNLTDPQGLHPLDGIRETPRENRAPSRVVYPADGQFPFQDWARALQTEFQNNLYSATRVEYIEPLAHCAPAGPTKSLLWHGFEIRQYPGYVLFLFDSGTRVIHLDDKPLLPEQISLWNGDSRGYWKDNTLFVTVHNHNGKSRFGRTGEFVSEHAQIQERFIFDNNGERFLYEVDYRDEYVMTGPFSMEVPVRRITAETPQDGWNNITFPVHFAGRASTDDIEAYERTCAEHNSNHGAVSQELYSINP